MTAAAPWWTPVVLAVALGATAGLAVSVGLALRGWLELRRGIREQAEAERETHRRAVRRYLEEEGGSHRGGFRP